MTTTISKIVSFVLPIAPMPTPRPRARVIAVPGRRPLASFYSPKEYKEWQKEALHALKLAEAPRTPFEGPVSVSVTCLAERPKTTKLPAPKPDVDNYAKGVLDAVTQDGRFWLDDSQVCDLRVMKQWAPLGAPGCIAIIIQEL